SARPRIASSSVTPCAPPTRGVPSVRSSRPTRTSPRASIRRPSPPVSTRGISCAMPRQSSGDWRVSRSPPASRGRSVAEPRGALAEAFVRSGKVRDLYRLTDGRLVLVASDRISAFDVVLPTAIPDKGKILTGLSRHWFSETADLVPNHLLGTDPGTLPEPFASAADELRGRIMICRTVEVLPIEVIVRGYVAGSGWKEYQRDGMVSGIPLPAGLRESERLPEPI